MSDTDLTARLAEALNDDGRISCDELDVNNPDPACPDCGDVFRLARALLPVVREYGDQRTAEELRSEADRIEAKSSHAYDEDDEAWEEDARELRARAATLLGEAGR